MQLAYLDLPSNPKMDGHSLTSYIESDVIPPERPLYYHDPHYRNQRGDPDSIIREGKWELIQYHETQTAALYNLEKDPNEAQNLAGDFPEIAGILK